ncbi:MAG: 6-hydroxymethylpterin diphosphokinase MptE-like protein [Candidatus Thermoplasmatota archaeon]
MKFTIWKPLYEEIVSDFGYSKGEDRKSAEILVEARGTDDLSPLRGLKNKTVEIGGPYFSKSDLGITIAAGASVSQILDKGVEPDLMVTDLDGDIELQRDLNLKGVPAVIHAHGDNIKKIKNWAEKFEGRVVSTCQCNPPEKGIYNFGGFTDGDRACFIAEHFGAEKVVLNGWDFDHPFESDNSEKLKKLRWAKKLINNLDITIQKV